MIKTTILGLPSISAFLSGLKEAHFKSFTEEDSAEILSKINREDRWTREIVLAALLASAIISTNILLLVLVCIFFCFVNGWVYYGVVYVIEEKKFIFLTLAFLLCILYSLWWASELFWFSFRFLIGVALLEGLKRVIIGLMNKKDLLRLLRQNERYTKEKLTARFMKSSQTDEKKRRKAL